MAKPVLTDADYALLADFRHTIRRFLAFSEAKAAEVGLTAQQHLALLMIRAASPGKATIGYLADRLVLQPNSVSGLVDRLEAMELITRRSSPHDRRQWQLALSEKAERLLFDLSATHMAEIQGIRPILMSVLGQLGR